MRGNHAVYYIMCVFHGAVEPSSDLQCGGFFYTRPMPTCADGRFDQPWGGGMDFCQTFWCRCRLVCGAGQGATFSLLVAA